MFNKVFMPKVKGSNFNLSHKRKTSFDIGELVPTCVMEVLPGDSFDINVEVLSRMAPMITPIMHNLDVYQHWFFVPNRITWPEWEDFITGQSSVSPPVVRSAGIATTDMGYHLGYRSSENLYHSAFPIAAMAMIYDEYYRPQYINTTEEFTELNAGTNNASYSSKLTASCYKRAWQHDYFTAALPTPQRTSAVEIPILSQTEIPVTPNWLGTPDASAIGGNTEVRFQSTGALAASKDLQSDANSELSDGVNDLSIDPNGSLEVVFDGLIPDINDLREALALQRWLEKEMRAGSRYIEHNMAFFGVSSSNKSLQRPEYIGGSKQPMVISEVLTTGSATGDPVGNMAGHGISAGAGKKFKYTAEEHGYIIGITSVLPESGYYNGVHKGFWREDRYEFGNPMFAMLGEQAIEQKEIYFGSSDNQATADTVFGYVPRFAEYKTMYNTVAGEFADTLEYWHMDRKFTSAPVLNTAFIECDTDGRTFASITGSNQIYALICNNVFAYRKLPKFGIPSIVG
jgi:hypothetical protein